MLFLEHGQNEAVRRNIMEGSLLPTARHDCWQQRMSSEVSANKQTILLSFVIFQIIVTITQYAKRATDLTKCVRFYICLDHYLWRSKSSNVFCLTRTVSCSKWNNHMSSWQSWFSSEQWVLLRGFWIRFVKTFSLALSDTWLAVKDIFVPPQRKAWHQTER